MSAYRDDLAAARERIRTLESELQSLQHRDAPQTNIRKLVRADSIQASIALPLVGVLLLGFLALRVNALAPIALGALLLTLLIFSLRGRAVVVRPNEIAVVREKNKSSMPTWVGPGRIVRLRRSASTESLSLRATPVSFTARGVPTTDDWIDVDLFAIVAVRRDAEGIERALRTFDAGPIAPIAQAALEDALRTHATRSKAIEFLSGQVALRDRLRKESREVLHVLGLELLLVGVVDVRPLAVSKGNA